jgi:tRNA-dihydrouridine synthase C
MEGVTDAPMRRLLTGLGGFTHAVSEFMRISETIPPDRVFLEHTPELKTQSKTASGVPVIFQLLGGNAEKLALGAEVAVKLGAKGIDLNFGCPAPTVNRHDGGATLLKYPERIFSIVETVRKALPLDISVSAKFRLGWDSHTPIYENAQAAERAGASWVTIHGRTKTDGYRPPAFWEPIGNVRNSLSIPVVANGDIWTLDDFKKCREQTGCQHFMLGRGAIANPHLPRVIARELGLSTEDGAPFPSDRQWKDYFKQLIALSLEQKFHPKFNSGSYALCRVKQWTKTSHNRVPSLFYDEIKLLKSLEEIYPILQ